MTGTVMQNLLKAFCCSLLLHWVVLFPRTGFVFFPSLPVSAPEPISVSIKNPPDSNERILALPVRQYGYPALLPRPKMVFSDGPDEPINAKQMVFDEARLDAPLYVIDEPRLEPAYGFADDVSGSVTLVMLIDQSGRVVHVWSEGADFDRNTMAYLVSDLKSTRFSVPMVKNQPVFAISRVEIEVGIGRVR